MAESKIRVDIRRLEQTKEDMQTRVDRVKKDIEKMQQAMNTLNAAWTGTANQGFRQSVEEDIALLEEVCETVQKIIKYESKAVKGYDKCESTVSDLIANIKV